MIACTLFQYGRGGLMTPQFNPDHGFLCLVLYVLSVFVWGSAFHPTSCLPVGELATLS